MAYGLFRKEKQKQKREMTSSEIIKKNALTWSIILAPCVFIAYNWTAFPDSVPIHFGINGQPDRFGDKASGLILLPAINIGMYLLFALLPLIDPRKKNYALFDGKFRMLRLFIHALLSFIAFVAALFALGMIHDTSLLISYGLVTFMLLFGNYLSGVRSNFFIGFRTPWTLSNEQNWTQTHRFGGRLWVISSVIMLVLLTLFRESHWLLLPYICLLALGPVTYSYYLFRKER
jgi:uncharacterized membrane protein